ncbi:MAG: mechanosensitive ion channel family protein [Acidimicrobiia bacterium]|nr:mechanosensitive ion channel family protein [Acidimicrobiia bacterium]MCY4456590.1 mechanosensitive ion channel family protein [Acidimicrobiaceae bacterium]
MTFLLAQTSVSVDVCGVAGSYICEKVYDWTGNELLATAADWLLDRPIRIIFILILAWIVSKVLQKSVLKFAQTIANSPSDPRLQSLREKGPGKALMEERELKRATARAETIGLVLRSIVVAAVWILALFLILGQLDIDLAPLIAGAGIGGLALGFGAQSIVKDFLSGLFMLIEDHYGVGDIVDVGSAVGTVESVSLRSTTIRDVKGTVWHVPNGSIARVGNSSQLWSRAVLDVEVAYDTDLELAREVIQRVGDSLWNDPEWGGDELMERPEVWGVQDLGASAVALRLVVKTEPSQQWAVERELRKRLKTAFDEEGIEIPFPQQTVWHRNVEAVSPKKKAIGNGEQNTETDLDNAEPNIGS